MKILPRLCIVAVALVPLLPWPPAADAQDCSGLPPGPAKKQCVMQNRPQAFEAKKEKCLELARARDSYGKGSGQKNFVQSCMQGKITP